MRSRATPSGSGGSGHGGESLAAELPEGALERRPVHWPLVPPEVFSLRADLMRASGFPASSPSSSFTEWTGASYHSDRPH
jgi:hypothetical protein